MLIWMFSGPWQVFTAGIQALMIALGDDRAITVSDGMGPVNGSTVNGWRAIDTTLGANAAAVSAMAANSQSWRAESEGTSMQDFGGDDIKLFRYVVWFRKKDNRTPVEAGYLVEEGPQTEDSVRGKVKQAIIDLLNHGGRTNAAANRADGILEKLRIKNSDYNWQGSDEKYLEVKVCLEDRRPRDADETEQEKLGELRGIREELRSMRDIGSSFKARTENASS
jgi:hypothetical protein